MVSPIAARIGRYGMAAAVRGGTSGSVDGILSSTVTSYQARFWVDPNGSSLTRTPRSVFTGLTADGTPAFSLELRRSGGYAVRLGVTVASGTAYTRWIRISDAYHVVSVEWAAGAPGRARLVVDGRASASLAGIDTSGRSVATVRLGPQGRLAGASGRLYFDAFSAAGTGSGGPAAVLVTPPPPPVAALQSVRVRD